MSDLQALIKERLTHQNSGFLGGQGHVLGIDLGSYGLRVAALDLSNHQLYTAQTELPSGGAEETVNTAIELAKGLLAEHSIDTGRIARIGVGFPGPVDRQHGTVRLSPRRAGWEQFPLQERFEQAFDAVTLIDNDANLMARGEAILGSGKGCEHLFYLHLSSGVGGGMVLDGRLYHGANSEAGEIGHAVIGQGWDGTGQPETLEERVAINGLLRRATSLGLQTDNLEVLFQDQTVGRQVVAEATELLAMRIAQIVALLDPAMVVLGGIVVRIGGPSFVTAIADRAHGFLNPQFARPVPIVASILGTESVIAGALVMTVDSLND